MSSIDRWFGERARGLARSTSRRGFLARIGGAVFGAAALPLLPIARGGAAQAAETSARVPAPGEPDPGTPVGDPESCDYWRHCAIDGFLCSCCGGTHLSCPPGAEMSPVTWIGTCRNPADGKDYLISYNDCCGKNFCGSCYCHRNERDKPVYFPQRSNDINWCMSASSNVYHCSTAIVLGVAVED